MIVLDKRGQYPAGAGHTAIALGYFDGVHRGHQQVIGTAQMYAGRQHLNVAVFTFIQPEGRHIKGHHLMDEGQKHEALEALGVQYCFQPPFESFCALTPQQFFEDMLVAEYRAKVVVCGENFRFGKNRAGNVELLQSMCHKAGVRLAVVPMTMYAGGSVSSSRIRQELAQGHIAQVNAMLGYPYEVNLPVIHGKKLGTRLGFPTINQVFPGQMQPPQSGVYITQTILNGKAWPSATGYGNRPTVGGQGDTCETFIPGFSGDVYGARVPVRFFKRIANTQKFTTPEALRAAVQAWAQQAVQYFKEG